MTTEEQVRYAMWMSRIGLLRTGAVRQTCIASARITTEVLRSLGIPARPMAAAVQAMTKGWLERVDRGEKPGPDWVESGACSIGIGYDPKPQANAFNAHMIVLAGEGQRYLLDPSLDQLARPDRDLPLEPSMVDMVEAQVDLDEFRRGRARAFTSWRNGETGAEFAIVWACFPGVQLGALPDFALFEERYGVLARSIAQELKTMTEVGLTGDGLPDLPSLPEGPDDPDLVVSTRTPEERVRMRMRAHPPMQQEEG